MSNLENRELEINKENSKAKKKFSWIIFFSALIGAVCGFALVNMSNKMNVNEISNMLGHSCIWIGAIMAPFVICGLTIAEFFYGKAICNKSKKEWDIIQKLEDDEYEQAYEKVDANLQKVLNLSSITTILSFGFFSVIFYGMIYESKGLDYMFVLFIISIVGLLAQLAVSMIVQRGVVDLTRIFNPEKEGSVYDTKFQDKWLESCDEAEKQMIYEAGFQTYKKMSNLCVYAWVIFTLLALVLRITLWPVVMVTVFWFLNTVLYLSECKKLSDSKKN